MIGFSFTRHADRQLSKLPVSIQKRIVEKIEYYLSTGNPLHYAEPIEGEGRKVYRFRVGDYRIIFDWNADYILVTKVSIRSRAY